eukprot:14581801-Alexandrium_andersonii.AAC.1
MSGAQQSWSAAMTATSTPRHFRCPHLSNDGRCIRKAHTSTPSTLPTTSGNRPDLCHGASGPAPARRLRHCSSP